MAQADFDRLWVWDDPAHADALDWYRAVATNARPAKFRIAATIAAAVDLEDAPEDALWAELDRLTPTFVARWQAIRDAGAPLGGRATSPTLLDLCAALGRRMLAHCNFCRWDCGVDRTAGGKLGACKLGAPSRVSSWFHHPGEELVYRGTEGSGTVFFTSCNMHCAFCQNGDISTDKDNGAVVSARNLVAMAWLLRVEGCHNVNWVGGDPTIHLHTILDAIALLATGFAPEKSDLAGALATKADRGHWYDAAADNAAYDGAFNAPMLWNSNFYMTEQAMRLLRLVVDVWLPDFKFGDGRRAITLARTPRYWETVTQNLALVHRWGEDLTIRHLAMPNHVECCTYPVLDWIAANLPDVPVNVMDQYHPDNFCDPVSAKYQQKYEAIARCPSHREIDQAYRRAAVLGLAYAPVTHERRRRRRV